MRYRALLITAVFAVATLGASWPAPWPPPAAAQAQSTGMPQAFLLGSWTGGLFPPPGVVSAEQCLMQPTVIFTRDLVLRASLVDQFYVQRLIETARGTGTGIEFRFSAANASAAAPAGLGLGTNGEAGFGCDDPDVLHVQRISPNEVRFPGCRDFPFPLIRCPAG